MKIGIYFGSTTGATESLAETIAEKLKVASSDVYNVSEADVATVAQYDCLLLGSSTWGLGELQDDWYDFVEKLKKEDLSGKKVAFFGTGDSEGYEDTFCDAMALLYDELANTGCEFIGAYTPADYSTTSSAICRDGKFIGLAIDNDNESNRTDSRVDAWVALIQ